MVRTSPLVPAGGLSHDSWGETFRRPSFWRPDADNEFNHKGHEGHEDKNGNLAFLGVLRVLCGEFSSGVASPFSS
jgi:hypothetical protein